MPVQTRRQTGRNARGVLKTPLQRRRDHFGFRLRDKGWINRRPGPKGITKPAGSNRCYQNVVWQSLMFTPVFRQWILEHEADHMDPHNELACVMCELRSMAKRYWQRTQVGDRTLDDMARTLQMLAAPHQGFAMNQPGDPCEFYSWVLDQLQYTPARTQFNVLTKEAADWNEEFQALYQIDYTETSTCREVVHGQMCGTQTITREQKTAIELQLLANTNTLGTMLNWWFVRDIVQTCHLCNQQTIHRVVREIDYAPQVLRIAITIIDPHGSKLLNGWNVPADLNLSGRQMNENLPLNYSLSTSIAHGGLDDDSDSEHSGSDSDDSAVEGRDDLGDFDGTSGDEEESVDGEIDREHDNEPPYPMEPLFQSNYVMPGDNFGQNAFIHEGEGFGIYNEGDDGQEYNANEVGFHGDADDEVVYEEYVPEMTGEIIGEVMDDDEEENEEYPLAPGNPGLWPRIQEVHTDDASEELDSGHNQMDDDALDVDSPIVRARERTFMRPARHLRAPRSANLAQERPTGQIRGLIEVGDEDDLSEVDSEMDTRPDVPSTPAARRTRGINTPGSGSGSGRTQRTALSRPGSQTSDEELSDTEIDMDENDAFQQEDLTPLAEGAEQPAEDSAASLPDYDSDDLHRNQLPIPAHLQHSGRAAHHHGAPHRPIDNDVTDLPFPSSSPDRISHTAPRGSNEDPHSVSTYILNVKGQRLPSREFRYSHVGNEHFRPIDRQSWRQNPQQPPDCACTREAGYHVVHLTYTRDRQKGKYKKLEDHELPYVP